MASADTLRRTRGTLNRLAHSGLDSFAYRERAIRALRASVPFDAAWWWTIDPASALFTSGVFEPFPTDHTICGGLHTNEFGDTDYNKFRVLHRRPGQVGVLGAATGGRPERSERYRTMLTPLGYRHELRLALGDDTALWGGVALLREPGAPDFTPAQARTVASLGSVLTEGLRIGVALGPGSDGTVDGPGMLMVDDGLDVLTITPNAERWLDELADGCPGLPDAVRSVVGHVRALHSGHDGHPPDGRVARVRVRAASGRWLAVHASRARGTAHTAVIIEEARPSEVAPLIVSAYGLSPREAWVTSLVLHGLSTKEIATEIHLSPYTVQDHLKVIFAKFGVRSRRELVAGIFEQYHWPRFGLGANAPESDGAVAGIHGA